MLFIPGKKYRIISVPDPKWSELIGQEARYSEITDAWLWGCNEVPSTIHRRGTMVRVILENGQTRLFHKGNLLRL